MDEKDLMVPLELGYVQVVQSQETHEVSVFISPSLQIVLPSYTVGCEEQAALNTCFIFTPRWRRETRIKSVGGRPQGEVSYYAPCGKKLRQYPDVMKVSCSHGAAFCLISDAPANLWANQ